MLARLPSAPDAALAGATPYLRLFGLAAGGAMLAEEALAASRHADAGVADKPGRVAVARFFAENLAAPAPALARIVIAGADAVIASTAGIGA
jgi:acyl-CoA dehydrogenase